mgnify:CR=1 FL=1
MVALGSSLVTWGARAGRLWFDRMKGSRFTDVVRAWVMPVAAAAASGKFLGLQSRWAIAGAIAIAVIVEVAAVLLGRWQRLAGAIDAEYQLAKETDPFKVESLRLLQEIRDRLPAGQAHASPRGSSSR